MEFMTKWDLSLQIIFIAVIVLGSAIFINVFFAIFKPKLSRRTITLFYAFSGGFILPLSIKGLLGASYENMNDHFSNSNTSEIIANVITMAVIGSGAVVAFIVYFVSHYIVTRSEVHSNHEEHDHVDFALNLSEIGDKRKWLAIIYVLAHRVPAGLTLGLLVYGLNHQAEDHMTLGLLIAFIIHVIPESLIVYYRQIDMKRRPTQALITTICAKLVLVPFMFIGGYLANAVQDIYWLFPLILAFGGTIMALAAILELLPEFIHMDLKSEKGWHYLVAMIMAGFTIALLILVIDKH